MQSTRVNSFNRLILKGGQLKDRLATLLIALVVAFLGIFLMWLKPPVLDQLEGSLLNARFELRGSIEPSGLVSIVAIDERSIEAYGRWPWSREIVAQLIDAINENGAVAIGLDIIFSEPQVSPAQQLLEFSGWTDAERAKLQQFAAQNNPDMALTTALFMAGNVVNGQFFYPEGLTEAINQLPAAEEDQLLQSSRIEAVRSRGEDFRRLKFSAVRHNLPAIAMAGEGAGFFNQVPESDGIVRNAPLVIEYNDNFYPSLALRTLSRFLNSAPIVLHADEFVINRVTLGDLVIPTNEYGALPINYRGPAQTIPHVSAADVLQGNVPAGAFANQMVLLGATAIGVFDAHSSPFGPEFPGLEIQANVLESIVQNDAIQRTELHQLVDFAVILLGCLLLAIVIPLTSRTPTRVLFFITLLTALFFGNYTAFADYNHWYSLWYPLASYLVCFVMLMLYQAFMVEARYSHVRAAFKRYISPDLVDQLTSNPDLLNFGGEERELSILFSDIRNFTNLSETVTPSELSRFLQAYMDPMTDCVFNNNGTLDKYIGDAVMAIFGAPVPFDSHPIDACRSALQMIAALDTIVETVPDLKRLFPVKIGIGVHTGRVVVGNMGSSQHFNYTVIGDSVNLAARIESLTKGYGVNVMISDVTKERVNDYFVFRELDCVRVKGKQEPVVLYELVGEQVSEQQQTFINDWQQALATYRSRAFAEAKAMFEQLYSVKPNNVSIKMYVDRCEHFIASPPPQDWDGVFTYTTK